MAIAILPMQHEDVYDMICCMSEAFTAEDPIMNTLYPEHWTETGRKACAERDLAGMKHDKHGVHFKAVDEATGKAVGYASWTVFHHRQADFPPERSPSSVWPTEEDAEIAHALKTWMQKTRAEYVKSVDGNAVHLEILAVRPEDQRQGVGGKLLEWGLKKADEMGVNAFLEASPKGRGLYAKNGFQTLRLQTFELPERFARKMEFPEVVIMVRPKP
ncbi:gnat family protein [Teratosphaeria destructans]|uniref:Gnat family protein n=1 Tax=Teratosphaeria destructans TaxID=418781 RepID=A0A9W7SMA1_9PEZI|nr:gnat family protein [Teratosphaeria destructans]